MPFNVVGDAPLNSVINVRVTSLEKEILKEEANLSGLTVSTYARRRLLGRSVLAKADVAVIRELRRMGGLAKAIYLENKGEAPKTAAILDSIREYIDKLSGDLDDRKENKKS
jgi:hypothetical protein